MCGWEDSNGFWAKKCAKASIEELHKEKEELLTYWKERILAEYKKPPEYEFVISSADPEGHITGPLSIINYFIYNYYVPMKQWDHQYYVWNLLYENKPEFRKKLDQIKNRIWAYSSFKKENEKVILFEKTFPEFNFSSTRRVFNKEKSTLKNLPVIRIISNSYRWAEDERPVIFSKLSIEHRRLLVNKITSNVMKEIIKI